MRVILFSCIAVLLLSACQSSLDVDANRKIRALDSPPSAEIIYIKPASVLLFLSRRDAQNSQDISYSTKESTLDVALDTSVTPVRIKANIQCPIGDTIIVPGNSTFIFVLTRIHFRVDSLAAFNTILLQGTPLKETGCALELLRYHIGFPTVDTLFIYPSDKLSSASSTASITFTTTYLKETEQYEIRGKLSFIVSVYDEFLKQTIALPMNAELLVYYP